jgi:DNA helicase-2/ATP-dependent DNA helicase PcrA
LLKDVPERQHKELYSENEVGDKIFLAACSDEKSEVEFVVKTIKDLIGKPISRRDGRKEGLTYKDFVILSRKRILGHKFASGLKAHGTPVVFVGDSNLFAMPVARDFMCFLRIAMDPERSGMEITRLMILAGVTEHNIAEINRIAKKKSYNDPTDIDFVFDTLKQYSTLNVTQTHTLKEIANLIENLITLAHKSSLSDLVYKVIMSISGIYIQSLISNKPEDQRNRLILKELHKISSEFESLSPHSSLSEFISHLMLMGEFDIELDQGQEMDSLLLSVTHLMEQI